MEVQNIKNKDIELLNDLQPLTWGDIKPYIHYYCSSVFCDPIKICDGNRIVAVGTSIKHRDTAWLAHIVVHPEYRNKGLGKEITTTLLQRLDPKTFQTVYLDATDMGYPVYQKVGFRIESEYMRLSGELKNLNLTEPAVLTPFETKYRESVLELDRISSAESRETVLEDHLKSSILYLSEGSVRGVYFPEFFDHYIMADLAKARTELMKLRIRIKNTAWLPVNNQAGINFLLENEYVEISKSRRMIFGADREWKGENNFNRVSGGLG